MKIKIVFQKTSFEVTNNPNLRIKATSLIDSRAVVNNINGLISFEVTTDKELKSELLRVKTLVSEMYQVFKEMEVEIKV